MNYTYILRCADDTLYCGWTNDLQKRLFAHNAGTGAKYTKSRRPVTLAYYELHESKQTAMQREAAIKKLPRQKKLALLQTPCAPLQRTVAGYPVSVFAPPQPTSDLVYLLTDDEDAAAVFALLREPKPVLVAVSGFDWNADLTPWSAPALTKKAPPFAGNAAAFLNTLTHGIVPETEQILDLSDPNRCLCGYSLAGLFALWALYHTDTFPYAVSASGSLWYDGFVPFAKTHPLCAVPKRVDLSLGDKEKCTKNARMAAVEDATLAIQHSLQNAGVSVSFTHNPGGHFQHPAQRLADAINRIYHTTEEAQQ